MIDEWQQQGACFKRTDLTDLFFPEWDDPPDIKKYKNNRAKLICSSCSVAADCLAYALADPGLQGTWGGSTEEERMILPRLRRGIRGI